MVNPKEKAIFRYVLNEKGQFIGFQPLSEDDSISTPIIPNLEFLMADIFKL
jgi:hypothetical protein